MIMIYGVILFVGILLGLNIARLLITQISRSETVEDKKKGADRDSIVANVLSRISALDKEHREQIEEPTILEKKILYEDELNRLLRIEQEISAQLQLGEIARIVVENAHTIFSVEKCALLLLNQETRELTIQYSVGIQERDVKNTKVAFGQGISGHALERNEILVINDFEKERWVPRGEEEYYYTGPLVSAPLAVKGTQFGVLNLDRKKTGQPFNDDDIRFLSGLAVQAAIAIQNAKLYETIQEGYLSTITALAEALDAKDPYTHRHSENVTRFSVAIAQELKLPTSEIEKIRRSGLLHDIGKIGIQDNILTKPGRLTDDEFEQIKTHPVKGENIVQSLPFLKEVAAIVRHHHERYNGGGYPDRLKGYQIELGSKILAVADAFDAMTSDRPYRKALGLEKATDELKTNSGTQFDPIVVEAFLKVLDHNPGIITNS
ncbi:HD domain-containing phosphohydrolase [Candidatus Omnitrophota bacterium]